MRIEFRYGKRIQQERECRAWTQEHLAQVAGIDTRTVQRVEKGETKSRETLLAIAAAFDMDLDALRTKWRIAESRLVRTWRVTSHREFVTAQEAHPWQMSCRSVVAPLEEEERTQAEELLERIFSDREYIEPYETELWRCWTQGTEEPLESLFELELAIFILDEQRDLLLPTVGEIKPSSDHMECRMQHIMVIPKHGCFRLSATEPLHSFNSACSVAGKSLLQATKGSDVGMPVYAYSNALWAAAEPGGEKTVRWCDTCFPPLYGGARLSFEYIEQVTGWNRAQLHGLCEAITGQPFLEGLA